jgi:hypothetical protein
MSAVIGFTVALTVQLFTTDCKALHQVGLEQSSIIRASNMAAQPYYGNQHSRAFPSQGAMPHLFLQGSYRNEPP